MAHNLVYFDSSTNSIQQFSNAQLDDLAERVLRVMAAGTYTGTITVGTTASIGTFADTALVDAAGGTNTTTVTNTYTLSQVGTATLGASADPPMHVGLDTSTPNQTVLQENLTTKEQLADEIIARMVASTGGTNAYYLATSAPSDGATWVSRGTLLDTKTNLTVTVTNYKLWQRTTSGATITNRDPVKLSSGNIQSFSTAEINALIKTIEQRIIATGIGTYVLQASAPGTGTWTNAGTIVDTKEDIATSNFVGPAAYVNENAIGYTATYLGVIGYTGDNAIAYAGSYFGTRTFFNPDGASFTATYFGPATYNAPTSFVNPNGAQFVNPDVNAFFNPDAIGFFNPDAIAFFNPDINPFVSGNIPFSGPSYAGERVFGRPLQGGGFQPYTGGPFPFARDYLGTRTYLGGANYFGGATYFGGTNYFGPASYFGPTYRPGFNSFTNPDVNPFSPGTYFGTTGPFVSADTEFITTYLGPNTFNSADTAFDGAAYAGTATYDGTAPYEGTRVAPTTSTISTRTLWRRIA